MNLLTLDNVVKTFGNLVAVGGVSFSIEENSIVGLIGPNGAGKTTVFNLITGNYRPDSGSIAFNGKSIVGLAPHAIVTMGIARTFQTIRLFQEMTVLENVLAGCHCRMRSGLFSSMFHTSRQQREEKEVIEQAMQELAFVGLTTEYNNTANALSYGNQRLLEIARALATKPKILILDEPAGGMNDHETAELLNVIFAIRARGISVLLIEHDMNLVMRACNTLIVLEHGMMIASGSPNEIKNNPLVIDAYLGFDE